jgi:hypothetical protein
MNINAIEVSIQDGKFSSLYVWEEGRLIMDSKPIQRMFNLPIIE